MSELLKHLWGKVQVFHADVKEVSSLFEGERFTLKCFMENDVVFWGDGIPPHTLQLENCLYVTNLSNVHGELFFYHEIRDFCAVLCHRYSM